MTSSHRRAAIERSLRRRLPRHAAVGATYERVAARFDARRTRLFFERGWLERFLAALPPGASVLDLGCGAGEPIARHLIARGCRVTGVDSAPTMIAICRRRFPAHAWRVGDMRRLALARRFDGLVAWDSFFHLDPRGQRKAVAVFARHARPGAALLFTSGPAAGEAIGRAADAPIYHASLDADAYRALLAAHGFAVVAHAANDPGCDFHTVWLARRIEARSASRS
jgi:SAM-dependent methyltransferase